MAPQRADARQNRAALLRSASRVFAEGGPGVALDAVARDAGVSIATLYRHFPSREALVAETYRQEIAQLADVDTLLARAAAAEALARWVQLCVEHARTKRALGELIHAMPADTHPPVRETLLAALGEILAAGARDGTLRRDMDAEDVLATLVGLWYLPPGPDWAARAERLTRFVLAGLRADGGESEPPSPGPSTPQ